MPIVLKSGNLNLLEPSGLVQACNGIAVPFAFFFILVLLTQISRFCLKKESHFRNVHVTHFLDNGSSFAFYKDLFIIMGVTKDVT